MKKFTTLASLCLAFFLLLASLSSHLHAQNFARRITASNGDTIPFLQYKPANHDLPGNTRKYPLIVFLHGIGERSDNTSLVSGTPVWNLQNFGPARQVNIGNKMIYTWAGVTDTFIVLSPMSRKTERLAPHSDIGIWPEAYINSIIKYAKDSLKVDTNRIYLTGLSYGGGGTFRYISSDPSNARKIAAAATVCAAWHFLLATGPTYVKNANLPLWGFHASDDTTQYATVGSTISTVDSINKTNPAVKAIKTIWPTGGHFVWGRVYDSNLVKGGYEGVVNIYEWFLGQNKSLPANILPVAHVGNDTTISKYSGVATLNGSTSTDDDTIVRYVWKKISGPAAGTIFTPFGSASSTTVSGLTIVGVYKYELNVVDNRAGIARDTLTIHVDSSITASAKAVKITSSGRISTGDVTQLKNASRFTLEAQFKYDSTVSTWTTLMCKSTSLTDRIMLHVGPSNNSMYVMVGNGTNSYGYTAANAVSPGTWYHVAAVFDGTQTGNSNRLKLYIDGVQQTLTFSGTIPASTSSTNTAAFRAGGELSCCGLNGTIDEVRVWDTVLSSGTITAWKDKLLGSCHPNIANLVVYWPLNNNANPAVATAELGTAYTGTIINGTYVTSSQATDTTGCDPGKAVTLTSLGKIATGDVTQLDNASKFTLEAQFKYDATVSNYTTLIRKSTSLTDRIMVHIGPNNNSMYVMVGNGSNSYGYTAANAVSPGTWYHVAAVYDGTQTGDANRLKLYIDGVQQTLSFSASAIPASTSTTNTAPFMAGGEPSCCYLNGTIDEVRVWDTVLSSGTITAWKDKLLGSCHPNIANLVVYWPLNNNANPSVATAELGTAYTGAITNGTYVTSTQANASSGCSGARSALSPSLEIVEGNKQFTGKIYPNPTDGLVQIELDAPVLTSVRVNVLDMFGRYLYRNKTAMVQGNRISLNLASFPAGTYIIEVGDGKAIAKKYKVLKR
jgi:predicted esterase